MTEMSQTNSIFLRRFVQGVHVAVGLSFSDLFYRSVNNVTDRLSYLLSMEQIVVHFDHMMVFRGFVS